MEQYQLIAVIAAEIVSVAIAYKVGKQVERAEKRHKTYELYNAVSEQSRIAKRLRQILKKLRFDYVNELNRSSSLAKANETMFDAGRKSVIEQIGCEMMDEHTPLKFVKIPKKKFINIKGVEKNDVDNRSSSPGIHISLN